MDERPTVGGVHPGAVRILIPVGTRQEPNGADGGFYLRQTYPRAIVAQGGIPVLFGGPMDGVNPEDVLEGMGGLLLTGGGDVDPERFGAARHPATGEPDRLRDEVEWRLTEAALAMGLPVFGICRGIQLLACVAGGTLVQDIPSERPGALTHQGRPPRDEPWHDVALRRDTALGARLARAAGEETVPVNSFHHQALAEVPKGFRLVATASDGIIEAIEREDLVLGRGRGFAAGVQWHPEDRWAIAAHDRALFATFVSEARAYLGLPAAETAAPV